MRYTIIGREIPNEVWPEILLAITHISKLLFTSSLNCISSSKVSTQSLLNLHHLYILGFTPYIFMHEKGVVQNLLNGYDKTNT